MNRSQKLTPAPAPSRTRGFTLIELLVVIAIIGLLVSILVPSLGKVQDLARKTKCQTNLRGLNTALAQYLHAHRDTYPAGDDPVSTDPFYWLWMGRGWRQVMEPYMRTSSTGGAPTMLFCPSDPAEQKYEATSYAYSMSFYHSPEQINSLSSKADTYSNALPAEPQRSGDVRFPSRKILIGEWTSNHEPVADDAGWWCWKGARNFLFADGSIRFLAAEDIEPAKDNLPDPNLTEDGIEGIDVQ